MRLDGLPPPETPDDGMKEAMNTAAAGGLNDYRPKSLRFEASGTMHSVKMAGRRGSMRVWQCGCGDEIELPARGQAEDGGEWEVLKFHWQDVHDRGEAPGSVFQYREVGGVADYFEATCACGWSCQHDKLELRSEVDDHRRSHVE